MSSQLISALHQEERSIVAELRASKPFQRLEGVRKLLNLYDAQSSVETGIEALVSPASERSGAAVYQIPQSTAAVAQASVAPSPPLAATGSATTATGSASVPMGFAETQQPIHLPGPSRSEPMSVDAAWSRSDASSEGANVVSSVRAALLGIGRN